MQLALGVYNSCDLLDGVRRGWDARTERGFGSDQEDWPTVVFSPQQSSDEGNGISSNDPTKTHRTRETTGPAASIRLTADRTLIDADGEDIAVLTVEALDKEGRPVPIAQNKILFKIAGDGALIGVGNGNPNCHESDKKPERSLFNGLAQVILQSTKTVGTIEIITQSAGLAPATLTIVTRPVQPRPSA